MTDFSERFVVKDPPVTLPSCNKCVHFRRRTKPSGHPQAFTCDAFPKGIPREILTSRNDHTKPFPGDHGIRFEPVEG